MEESVALRSFSGKAKPWPLNKRRVIHVPIESLRGTIMQLGNFSVSLNVKDLQASKTFYAALGFEPIGGDDEQGWTILKNGDCLIGLFQGMFEKNTLTFNPGWNAKGELLDDFTDVRDLQRELKSQGMALASEADEDSTGPAGFMVIDPDGNPVLVDQHV